MTDTPRLKLPAIEASQAQKHVTHNEALALLDAFVQLAAESRSFATPPSSPAEGDTYIVAASPTDAWSGWSLMLAVFSSGAWIRLTPPAGCKAFVKDERLTVTYNDGAWRDGIALTVHGGRVTLRAKEEELVLSGTFVETTDSAFIPNRAIVLGVASRTTLAIAGASSYDVGLSGEASKFGGSLGIALSSTNMGVIGPTAYYADTKVRITANGSNFTAGKVRLVVYFLEMSVPAS